MKATPLAAVTILFGLFIAAIVVLADTSRLGFLYAVYDFPNGDKVAHFLLYGTLSFLTNLGVLQFAPGKGLRPVLISSVTLSVAIAAEELSQVLFPSRSPDILDLLASLGGVAAFAMLAILWWGYWDDRRSARRLSSQ